jgi:hypothetical protein
LVGVENLYTEAVAQQPGASALVYYPLKISNFFKERLFHLNRLLMGDGPSVSITGPKQVIIEKQIANFESAAIDPENYPSICAVSTPTETVNSSSQTPDTVNDMDPLAADAKLFHGYYADRLEILQRMV